MKESKILFAEKNNHTCYLNKKRLIVKKGCEHILINCHEIACIFNDDKKTIVIDRNGNKYSICIAANELEVVLDPEEFFNSRHLFLNVNAIKSYIFNNDEKVEIKFINSKIDPLVLSSKDAINFKKWVENLQYTELAIR
jgi:DNA-binding LytR/AlgR family response regulator